MKKSIIIILISIIVVSCKENDIKNNFIGKWTSVDNFYGLKEFEFYHDSLIGYEEGQKYFSEWNVDESKIYINRTNQRTLELIEKFEVEYEFSENKDSLYFKRSTDTIFFEYPVLVRIDNRLN